MEVLLLEMPWVLQDAKVNDSASKLAEVPAASPMVEATLPEACHGDFNRNVGDGCKR